jgi:antitoxin HicB
MNNYPFEVRPLSDNEGGGFLISYPDFNQCVSDGETVEEAIKNGQEALTATIAALEANGLPIPQPDQSSSASGKFIVRVPKSLHSRLAGRAKREGVSLNTLILSYVSAGVGLS